MFSGKCVEGAAHSIEFAEIESENFHQNILGFGVWKCDVLCFDRRQDHGAESPEPTAGQELRSAISEQYQKVPPTNGTRAIFGRRALRSISRQFYRVC